MAAFAPNIRFEGFSDPWEKRRSGDIAPLRGGYAFKSSEYCEDGIPIIRISNILPDGSIGADFTYYDEKESDDIYALYDGATVLAMSGATTGKVSVLHAKKGKKYYQNQRVGYFMPTDNCDYGFISIIMRSNLFAEQLSSVLVTGAQPNVSPKEIDAFEFVIPVLKDEQQTIGSYFRNLDNLITQHQSKADSLKEFKKYMLSNMFPKEGEDTPEIRFEGFTEPWEKRKFSDFALRESNICASSPEYPSVEYEDVITGEGRLNKDICKKEIQKKGIFFDGNQVLYGKLRPYLHNWLNPEFAGVAVGDWWVLTPIEMDKSFLYRLIQTQKFDEIANLSAGSKMPRADWSLISNTEFNVPSSLEEQQAIGSYFRNLDSLISQHQSKADALKEVKKYMLSNMFPKN